MPETDLDVTDVTVQPSLPELELPEYRGRKPVGMKTSVNGAGNRVARPHGIEDRVVFVVEAKCKASGHKATDDGIIYAEVLQVVDLFEVAGDPGRRLLSVVRQAYRVADDDREGRQPIPGVDGWTDESGTVVSPEELAEVRGDPARALADERLTPAVVLFSDGARQLWPDEFDEGEPCPAVGDRYADERIGEGPASYVYVAKLLHAETGETLAEWTDDQEEARLLRMEEQLANEERIADDLAEVTSPPGGANPPGSGEGTNPDEPAGRSSRGERDPASDSGEESAFRESTDSSPPDKPGNVLTFNGPTADDYKFIDRNAPEITADLPGITDQDQLMRLLKAEENGRGRGLKPRKGVLEAIGRREAELFSQHPSVAGPARGQPDGFDSDEGA